MDWESAYINLDPAEALRAHDERLCQELFNPFLDSFAQKIKLVQKKNQKLLVSGHVGSGKSTMLNLLQVHPDIRDNFIAVKYSIKDTINQNDIDIIDLLLSIHLQTAITSEDNNKINFDDQLNKSIEETGALLKDCLEKVTETTSNQ